MNISSPCCPGQNRTQDTGAVSDAFNLTRTGVKLNHNPNAVQNGVSMGRLRTSYEVTISMFSSSASELTNGGEVRWMRERRSGLRSWGK